MTALIDCPIKLQRSESEHWGEASWVIVNLPASTAQMLIHMVKGVNASSVKSVITYVMENSKKSS